MKLTDNIIKIIEQKIGADINLLGIKSVESAVSSGIKKFNTKTIEAYGRLLQIDNDVYNSFVEDIMVPKTWFFRNKDSFIYLKDVILKEWKMTQKPLLKVLSIPCSTGEEPYSIAATLFEAGLNKNQFHIDAMDISNKAIISAKRGVYFKNHSQIEDISFGNRYIHEKENHLYVDDILKGQIFFINANLLDISNIDKDKYDIIFCRNIFIYFNQRAREIVLVNLKKKLRKGGIIFTGHAELSIFLNSGFTKTDSAKSFSCKPEESILKKPFDVKRDIKFKKNKIKKIKEKEIKAKVKKVIKINNRKEEVEVTYTMIKSFADIGDYQKAMVLCETYVKKMEPNAEIFYIKGLIHQLQNSIDNAQINFEKAIYLKPDHYDALLHMSFLMEKRGRYQSAELFKKRAKRSFEL